MAEQEVQSELSSILPEFVNKDTGKFELPTLEQPYQSVDNKEQKPTGSIVKDLYNSPNTAEKILATGIGAGVGRSVAKSFPDYVAPEVKPNPAQIARDEWLKNQAAHQGGLQDYELKFDALKRQSDDLAQLHLMEKNELEKARNAYIEEKIKAKTPLNEVTQKIILPDEHTRQIQGQGSEAPNPNTGRANQTGYQARTQEIAEHGAAGKSGLQALQTQGLVKPGGITLEFPGITASSPMGVLAPAPMQTEFDLAYKKIIESSIPQEQKLAMLKDLYQEQKTAASSAATAKKSAEAKLLEHMNSKESQVVPLERAALESEKNFKSLGGHSAAGVESALESPIAKLLSKARPFLGPLGGALAGHDIYKGYQAQQAGDTSGAVSNYASGLGGALMMVPNPITFGAGAALTAGGIGKDMYDYYMSLPPEKQKEFNQQLAIGSQSY
jgi:hypothetical protein